MKHDTTLHDIIQQRLLVLDGAMGTMIQQYDLTEQDFRGELFRDLPGILKGNNDVLSLTRPDIVEDIHNQYLEAGADIIETNTFSAQSISMQDYHLEDQVRQINQGACRIARKAADRFTALHPQKPRFVAGSIGPTNRTCSLSPDISNPALRNLTFDQLAEAYLLQMQTMLEEGVDALLVETIFDTLNAKAAIYAAQEAMKCCRRCVPLMLSVTISDQAGRTLSGQTLEAFLASIRHAEPFSIGLNCSFGAAQMLPHLRRLAELADTYISVHPNAGLPNAFGTYDQTPQQMAQQIQQFVDERLVNIIGGCCGTTPQHIRLLSQIANATDPTLLRRGTPASPFVSPVIGGQKLRAMGLSTLDSRPGSAVIAKRSQGTLHLSGLEVLSLPSETDGKRLTIVGERCNVAGSRKFLRLIKEKNYQEALDIAHQQIADGAQILDINLDDPLLDTQAEMQHFLFLLQSDPDIARVPLMIDSSDWSVIRTALRCIQGKGIVNSISLKEGEETFLAHAREIRRMGAAVVVMAFDEHGQATTYQRKTDICSRAYHLLVDRVDFPPSDIIFDPNVLAIATGISEHNSYALDFIQATGWIRHNLPGAHVSGGISNLSYAFRGNNPLRQAIHTRFLYHTIKAGQDFAILNPTTPLPKFQDVDEPDGLTLAVDDLLLNRRPDATDQLLESITLLSAPPRAEGSQESTPLPSSEGVGGGQEEGVRHLADAIIHGDSRNLPALIADALTRYPNPLDIISGPLMQAMTQVGQRFSEGKMYLPQVVKTARTMQQAVQLLTPHLNASPAAQQASRTILLATVKGDVHDIGKNIVAIVMACNGYNVIDLGIMVPPDEIVRRAQQDRPDIIGLSALITPSLNQIVDTVKALQAAHLHIPVMVGGATTSLLHTALAIAPHYDAPVVHVADASQNPIVAAHLLDPQEADAYVRQLQQQYQQLRKEHEQTKNGLLPIEEARKNRPHL